MRVPLSWLRERVEVALPAEELARALSRSGTLVEEVHAIGVPAVDGNLDRFRVGRVLSAERHPDADRLRVCAVDLGGPEPAGIVCGAPNVAAGQTVAVALPGALLPGAPKPLGVAKLRGVESRGMILSAAELAIPGDASGIMVLEDGPAPGTPLAEVLPLSETVLELEITSNRPDCLAVQGVAREVHAVTGAPLVPLDESDPPAEGPGRVEDHAALEVQAPDLCPRYMARVFTEVRVGPSPAWLVHRLEAAGMRSISNVVDVTNYVMLLTGQPLHAFDLDRLAGRRIVVRRAGDGEPITTLDGQRRTLDPAMLAICDAEQPAVIAGIFGAEFAEVAEGTTRVLLEAATFDGPSILDASLRLGLRTESSGRFEKGLPRELPQRAMAIASRMLVELCGARMVPGTLDAGEPPPPREPVRMRHARLRAVLGIDVPPAESQAILERLGMDVEAGEDALTVVVPFERAGDVTREIDLVEEVARVHGLDGIPAELPRLVGDGRLTPQQALVRRLSRLAADLGLHEAITYRQVPESDADALRLAPDDPRRRVVRMARPMSAEMAVMRRSMLPGLLRAVARNQAHQRGDGGLFEVGRTYAPREDGMADERLWLAAVRFGAAGPAGWRDRPRPVDVHSAIGLATTLCRAARVRPAVRPNAAPYFHPVRQARLVAGDDERPVGWAAEVHPLVLRAFDAAGPVAAVVLDLDAIAQAAGPPPRYEDLLTVPVSTRDLALVVAEGVPAAELVGAAREAGAPLVREVAVFDRYAGEQVEAGHVSLALRLELADPGRTLTDDEIEGAVARVREALAGHGARLRG
ncbi:phenylalanine--tRNA ligase subunit beta [Miltoncostaea marina]|uniref:phenylalanine--tRNA ligase subunit beta n=1 Tax=Miltoncostaea marina TaxID=2843215 RepID=UPI001C3DA642|nr:phenylalanine--tRNA ligase subunit beta [Miltoncostaea marina]